MATGTASLATAAAPIKMLHAGANTVHVSYNSSGHTLSDIIYLCKLPQKALVTQVDGTFFTSNADSVIKLGWDAPNANNGSETAFGTHTSSLTDQTTNFSMTGDDIAPVLISFTDSIGLAYARVYATCSVGSFSDSFSINVTLTYVMDHTQGVD